MKSSQHENKEEIKEFELSNGLRVIHKHLPDSGIVDVRLTLKAGAIYEPEKYKAGTAHFLEHIVHEKTEKYANKELLKNVLMDNGGHSNATTSGNERMFFYATVLKEFAENAFDYVSQVVFHSVLTADAVEKHRSIITQEMHQVMKRPGNKAFVAFKGLAYGDTQYATYVIGTEESIKSITLEELQSYYAERFQPQHCLLSIYGDISGVAARELADRYFARVKASKSAQDNEEQPREIPFNPMQKGYAHVISDESQALLNYGGIFKGKADPKYFSLSILLRILAGDSSSILYKILRDEKHLTYSVGASRGDSATSGLFMFELNISQEHVQEAISIIREEVAKISRGEFDTRKLELAKVRIKASEVLGNQTVQGKASNDSDVMLFYTGMSSYQDFIKKFDEVTEAEVKETAAWMLERLNLLVVVSNKKEEFVF